jgi:4-hydroxy 2-oxovalerate aldolase
VDRGYKLFDNSVLMLLKLLKRLHISKLAIAGMDGFLHDNNGNYFNASFDVERLGSKFDEINREICVMLENYVASIKGSCAIEIITPSLFEGVFTAHEYEYGRR